MDEALTIFGIAWRFAVGAATVIALAFIVWNIAAAIEERRIERKRKQLQGAALSPNERQLRSSDGPGRTTSCGVSDEKRRQRGTPDPWLRIVVTPARAGQRDTIH